MLEPDQPQLPGVLPLARFELEVLLNPDGSLYHQRIRGTDPAGALMLLESYPAVATLDDMMQLVRVRARLQHLVNEARHQLRTSYRPPQ